MAVGTALRIGALTSAAALLAGGCSSGSHGSAAAPGKMTAAQVASTLKAAGLPLGEVTVFDEDTDPNHQLGRPGKYTSKVGFVDTRVDLSNALDTKGDISRGGGVEVWPDHKSAQARADYIQALTKDIQATVMREYDYISGSYLLRITQTLSPTQAGAYEAALKGLGG
ncbi:hypothetical protein [Yinghuangia seranimata]|uniref:hypothetical protein n=1 Tax=Yinghuangia seranimata TaxID=408067 RepID=UPI00248B7B9B|nr:hypothetical protein [Yinghuangia seranimata]MDI2129945.1 hypothetical protein [Yinghuangia seranimata]MDI2131623.1 hypothetical protein [Yinghuangia seranimata]